MFSPTSRKRTFLMPLGVLVVLVALAWLTVGPQQLKQQGSVAAQAGAPVVPLADTNPIVNFYHGPLPYHEMPGEVSPGHDFKFTLTFENPGPGTGYGPYIDLYLPALGIDDESSGEPCDGITFVQADGLFTSPPTLPLTTVPATGSGQRWIIPTTAPSSHCKSINGTPNPPHPFGGTIPISLPATNPPNAPEGYELVVIKLPFGSYYPTQGKTYVDVTAHVRNYADAGTPLTIFARGGFQFGIDPLGVTPPVPREGNFFVDGTTTPEPFTVSKICTLPSGVLCPEDESATGPNFPMNYVATVDIDDGLKIDNLTVRDILPDNVKYDDHLQVTVHGQAASLLTANNPPCSSQPSPANPVAISAPTGPGAGGILEATLCGSIIGTAAPDDIVISFQFYIPALDAAGQPVLPADCGPALAINDVSATGDWLSPDPRDAPPAVAVSSDVTPADHTLHKKCLAIQKTASPAVVKPGDTITYTLNFQVSDYLQVGSIGLRDLLSDGQHYVPNSATLSVIDKTGSLAIGSAAFTPFLNNGSLPQPVFCGNATPWPFAPSVPVGNGLPLVGTLIDFDISAAIISQYGGSSSKLLLGYLTGGQIPPTGGPGATGTITFQTQVDDEFSCPDSYPPPADKWVDKFDRLYNAAYITGDLINRVDQQYSFASATDDSGVMVPVAGDTIMKCIYSIDRLVGVDVPPPTPPQLCAFDPAGAPPQIAPGDKVTFRILKTIPSGDHEGIDITDFLPHPVLQPVPITSGPGPSNTCPPGVPTPLPPTPPSNSLNYHYPPGNDPTNQPCVIDILLAVTVTGDPYADGLLFTNEAIECEQNSFNETICQTAVAPMQLTEPRLRITKGVVAACQPDPQDPQGTCLRPAVGTFTPLPVGPVVFNNPGSPLAWGSSSAPYTPPITSASLAPNPINSNVNVDAGDIVTFAVVVENLGSGLSGAFDVKINDLPGAVPPWLIQPPFPAGYNFSVTDGTGAPFLIKGTPNYMCAPCNPANSATFATAFFSSGGIELVDPGPTAVPPGALDPYSATSGHNIAIITYSLQVSKSFPMGQCLTNTVSILHYAGLEAGPNHVGTAYGGPYSDTAEVCIRPNVTKFILTSSEAHTAVTPPTGAWTAGVTEELTIGEIVRYRLDIVLPEGMSPGLQVRDFLPAGLTFMPGTQGGPALTNFNAYAPNAQITVTGGTSSPSCIPAAVDPVFYIDDLNAPGTLNNLDRDPDPEILRIEFNALVCNVAGNQDTPPALRNKDNYAEVTVNGSVVTSNTVNSDIVEPNVTITKQVAPDPLLGPFFWNYTIDLVSNGTADAFDVHLTDQLPNSVIVPNSLTWNPSSASVVPITSLTTTQLVDITIGQFPTGQSLSIQFTTESGKCANSALVTWTSLPGPLGTTLNNPTHSITPGLSGAVDGERNGSGGVNDYRASDSVTSVTGCGTVTPTPNCANHTGGPARAWWHLDETTGAAVVTDISGGGHNGTPLPAAVGPPGWPRPGALSPVIPPAVVGGSLYFNSDQTYVQVPHSAALEPGSGDFSIEAWVYPQPNGPGYVQPIVDKWDAVNQKGYSLYIQSPSIINNARLTFVYGDGSLNLTVPSISPIAYSQWHHVAVTVKRNAAPSPGGYYLEVLLYVDGVQQGAQFNGNPVGSIASNLDLLIGGTRLPTPSGSGEIALDEVQIFDRALSAPEARDIFNAHGSGKCRPVTPTPTGTVTPTPPCVINISKVTLPASNVGFTFNSTWTNQPTPFTISHGNTFAAQVPCDHTYRVTEKPHPGWTLTNIGCVVFGGTSSFTTSVPTATVNITVVHPGDAVNCQFTNTQTKQCGDVNDDGRVNSIDASLMLQYIAGLIRDLPNRPSADVNGDGTINAIDVLLILQHSAGFDVNLRC